MTHDNSNWIAITNASNIPAREGRSVSVGHTEIAIFNLGERFAALENKCPHRGGPLADGIVGGTTVTCPLHNWRVCVDTGDVTKPAGHSACVRSYAVKVNEGIVYLNVAEVVEEEAAA
ncbi:MAG: nitrite reductase small subunit NirD [Candidatus Solibacter usitatus]|nr:nitrite reductase small subunit NirD [Candidatus Solibacter usitatus]